MCSTVRLELSHQGKTDLSQETTLIMSNLDVFEKHTKKMGTLTTLSWNIQDCSMKGGSQKVNESEFTDILNSSTIFCLQETKGPIDIKDYDCINKLRKGSRSGGLCIGVHESFKLCAKMQRIKSKCPDILAIKFTMKPQFSTASITLATLS